ncbi:hypothetical protein FOA43_002990 [Brettanomyces nanus]|uniref:GST C-terminal domain-containing protein n=1 Tax=Eeniella nana TaxID=13502 RepID=A0A875S404_EENNA|nr:uncharacterized protein FOA43_002990 [Brettanomyces nanus]QPG75633.1 hypothetical protein FOA43_002990 [Brettanomyces nanus]
MTESTTPIGTIYLLINSPRSAIYPALIKYLGLNIAITDNRQPHFSEAFPLHKCPAFESKDGWKLHETLAIMEYFISLKPQCKYNFWGNSPRQKAKVWQWLSFTNTDCVASVARLVYGSSTPESITANQAVVERNLLEFDAQLCKTAYLTGSECTLADVFAAFLFAPFIDKSFMKTFLLAHPITKKWLQNLFDNEKIVSPFLKDKI